VADSGGYDYKEHGLSSTKLRLFLWLVVDCMEYIVAKEQVILSIGGPGNMTAK